MKKLFSITETHPSWYLYAHFFGILYGKLAGFRCQISHFRASFLTPDASSGPFFGFQQDVMNIHRGKYRFRKISFLGMFRLILYSLDLILVEIPIKGQKLAKNGQKRSRSGNFPKPILCLLDLYKILLSTERWGF